LDILNFEGGIRMDEHRDRGRHPIVAAAVLFLALGLAGCGSTPPRTTGPSETTTSQGQEAQAVAGTTAARNADALIKFINADPEGKSMDIWSRDASVFSDVPYKTTTPYIEIPAGETRFELRENGRDEQLSANLRLLMFGRHYTLVALPRRDRTSKLALMIDNLGLLEPGNVRVRLINATADIDDLDLYIAGTKTRIQSGVDASMVTSFADTAPGMLEIRRSNQPPIPALSKIQVEANRLYTFVVVGNAAALELLRIETRIDE
jgi:hypothetical protein